MKVGSGRAKIRFEYAKVVSKTTFIPLIWPLFALLQDEFQMILIMHRYFVS